MKEKMASNLNQLVVCHQHLLLAFTCGVLNEANITSSWSVVVTALEWQKQRWSAHLKVVSQPLLSSLHNNSNTKCTEAGA